MDRNIEAAHYWDTPTTCVICSCQYIWCRQLHWLACRCICCVRLKTIGVWNAQLSAPLPAYHVKAARHWAMAKNLSLVMNKSGFTVYKWSWLHEFHSFVAPMRYDFKNIQITQVATSAQDNKRPCQENVLKMQPSKTELCQGDWFYGNGY